MICWKILLIFSLNRLEIFKMYSLCWLRNFAAFLQLIIQKVKFFLWLTDKFFIFSSYPLMNFSIFYLWPISEFHNTFLMLINNFCCFFLQVIGENHRFCLVLIDKFCLHLPSTDKRILHYFLSTDWGILSPTV